MKKRGLVKNLVLSKLFWHEDISGNGEGCQLTCGSKFGRSITKLDSWTPKDD